MTRLPVQKAVKELARCQDAHLALSEHGVQLFDRKVLQVAGDQIVCVGSHCHLDEHRIIKVREFKSKWIGQDR